MLSFVFGNHSFNLFFIQTENDDNFYFAMVVL